jgi:hypothetical protein
MKKILLPGLVASVAMIIVNMLFGYLVGWLFPSLQASFMAEYEKTNMFRPMNDPLMILFFINPFIYAFPYAWGWNKIKDKFSGSVWCNAFYLTGIVFFITTLPGMFITYTCFVISLPMIISWLLSAVVQTYAGWLVICSMAK